MDSVEIIDYQPQFRGDFEKINKIWVEEYFSLEPFDIAQLEHPEDTIIAKGGVIIFARIGNEIVGTVGLAKVGATSYELIKMGVLPNARGKKVGRCLGENILRKAKELGAAKVVLYSNTQLVSALNLYRKLGFEEVANTCNTYERCDIKMEIML